MKLNLAFRKWLFLCLALSVVTMLSAASAWAVHSTTSNHGMQGGTSLAPTTTVLYDNGPTTGQLNAFFIDGPGPGPFSQTISDGFVAANSGNANEFLMLEWVPTGTTPTSLSWSLGTSHFGSEIASGSTGQVNFSFFGTTPFGFDTYVVDVQTPLGNLTAGNTYYFTLGGANDSLGTQFDAWDVNEGPASCYFAVGGVEVGGCPTTESQTFVILANTTGVPEPGSLMLFASGVAGLAGVLRRKFTR